MSCGFAHQRGTPHRSNAAEQQTTTTGRPERQGRSSPLPEPSDQDASSHPAPITNLSPTRAYEGWSNQIKRGIMRMIGRTNPDTPTLVASEMDRARSSGEERP